MITDNLLRPEYGKKSSDFPKNVSLEATALSNIKVTGIFTARAGNHHRTGVRTIGIEKNDWTRYGAEGSLDRDM